MRTVVGLTIYPFKSAAGIHVETAEVDAVGLRDDRAWMAVDAEGTLISQRTHPRMALLRTRLDEDVLEVSAPEMATLRLPRAEPSADRHSQYRVWFSRRYAVDAGAEAGGWLSDYLGQTCRVLRSVRPPGAQLLTPEGRVRGSFADASPALVISRASLDDLNGRLEVPLPMDRFRPNVVVDGFGAYEEDQWGRAAVGDVPTRGGTPCPRCATTLVDQETAEKGVEPLRTLNGYRRNAEGLVDFGVSVFFERAGVLRVGDAVSAFDAEGGP